MKPRTSSAAFLPLNALRINLPLMAVLTAALLWVPVPAKAADAPAAQQAKGNAPARAPSRKPDVIYVPTPQAVVDKMLEMAEVKPGDVVYDLGCGDGRVVATAAKKYGVKAIGFDIDPVRVKESIETVRSNKVEHLASIKEADVFTLDLREATVVFLYLLPSLNVRLMPQLEKLKPGSRIVSHDFDMRGAKPAQVVTMGTDGGGVDETEYEGNEHTLYKWVVPWEKEPAPPDSEKKAGNDK